MKRERIIEAIQVQFPEADLSDPEFESSADFPDLIYVKPAEPIKNGTVYTTYIVDIQGQQVGRVRSFRPKRRQDGSSDDTLP